MVYVYCHALTINWFPAMRLFFFVVSLLIMPGLQLIAQQSCTSFDYQQQELTNNNSLRNKVQEIENFIQQQKNSGPVRLTAREHGLPVVTIPVVIHILYHVSSENISNDQVLSQ